MIDSVSGKELVISMSPSLPFSDTAGFLLPYNKYVACTAPGRLSFWLLWKS